MDNKFDQILEALQPLFKYKECSFGYQRKNCKKHGHLKKRTNKADGVSTYEIRIEKNDNDAAKIYTLIHELTHHLNDHLDSKELTYAQQEWVADEVGMFFIEKLGIKDEFLKSSIADKWDVENYGNNFIANKRISQKRLDCMNLQRTRTINCIKDLILLHFKAK